MTQPVQAGIPLVNRSVTVTVGSTQVTNIGQQVGLDVWAHVRRSLRPQEPNTADLRLYNLSDASRKAIEAAAQPIPGPAQPGGTNTVTPVKIVAGYVGNTSTLFLGEMRSAQTMTDGPDTVTELTTGDGDNAAIIARMSQGFSKGANAYAVARALLTAMGLGSGNIDSVAAVLKASPLYANGVVVKGNAMAVLKDLCASVALEVSVQGGVAQFLSLGQPLDGQAYVLSSDTGMVGTPSVDTKGVLTVATLLLPGLRPGSPVQMAAKYVQGLYRVISIESSIDTAGNDFQHMLECRKYNTGLG